MQGGNWGQLKLSEANISFETYHGDELLSIPFSSVNEVVTSRNLVHLTLQKVDQPLFLRNVKWAVPQALSGFETEKDPAQYIGKRIREHSTTQLQTGTLVGKFELLNGSLPAGTFTLEVYTEVIILRSLRQNANSVSIPVQEVNRQLLLPVPSKDFMYLAIDLQNPIRLGVALSRMIVLSFQSELAFSEEDPWKPAVESIEEFSKRLNTTPDQMLIKSQMVGPLSEVVAAVIKQVSQKPLHGVNKEFTAPSSNMCGVSAGLRGSNGSLYLLKSALLFLHRPATVIPYQHIAEVQADLVGLTWSLILERSDAPGKFKFINLNKKDVQAFEEWFTQKGVTVKGFTPEVLDDFGDFEDEGSEDQPTSDDDDSEGDSGESGLAESD